jgi:TIR domain
MAEKVNIFISYKKGDVALANALDRIFGNFGGDRVETFVATKMIPGTLWENWIRDSLAKSHLLLLIFTGPDQDWGWCLFEAGLFLGLDVEHHRHVVCIYQPANEPPRPLKSMQTLEVHARSSSKYKRHTLYVEDSILRYCLNTDHNTSK